MRALIQRVTEANVAISGARVGAIYHGLLVLLGIEDADNDGDIAWLVKKILGLRIFDNEAGQMDKSILDIEGEILVVSQFTLHASTKKGNRPSYSRAANPVIARPFYDQFISTLSIAFQKEIATGEFGADMQVSLVNDGPVTLFIDSKDRQ